MSAKPYRYITRDIFQYCIYPEFEEEENIPLLEPHAELPEPVCDIPEPEEGGVDKSGGGSKKDNRSSASTSSNWNESKIVFYTCLIISIKFLNRHLVSRCQPF